LPAFLSNHHPNFTVAYAPVQQSSAHEDASRIYAEIERLKKLKETNGWNDANWVEARQLHQEELNLDAGFPDNVDDTSLHPLGEWLADIVDPLPLPEAETFVAVWNPLPRLPPDHVWREPKEWYEEVHDLLQSHFNEIKTCATRATLLAKFDWDNPPEVEISYAQARASTLWGEYFDINFVRNSKLHMKSAVLMATLSKLLDTSIPAQRRKS
jgi:hypothetical protein